MSIGETADDEDRSDPKSERCGEGVAPRRRRGEEVERCGDADALGEPPRDDDVDATAPPAAAALEGDGALKLPLQEAAADDAVAKAADDAALRALERDPDLLGEADDRFGDGDAPRAFDGLGLAILALLLALLACKVRALLVLLTVLRACDGVGDEAEGPLRPKRPLAPEIGDIAERDGVARLLLGGAAGVAGINRSDARAGVVGGSSDREPSAAPSDAATSAAPPTCELVLEACGLLTRADVGLVPLPATARGDGIGRHRGDSGGSAWEPVTLKEAGGGFRFGSTWASGTPGASSASTGSGGGDARSFGADELGTPNSGDAAGASAEGWVDCCGKSLLAGAAAAVSIVTRTAAAGVSAGAAATAAKSEGASTLASVPAPASGVPPAAAYSTRRALTRSTQS